MGKIKVYMKNREYAYFCNVVHLKTTKKYGIFKVFDRNDNYIGILEKYISKNENFIPADNTEIIYI
jgi:hypothetical protein